MGSRQWARRVIAALFIGGIIGVATAAAGAVPAVVLTNQGQAAEGTLTGIGPVIRLLETDGVTSIGPGLQFGIPLSSIRQITIDFPRVVIEAENRTLIGPYSSFAGIAEALQLDRAGEPSITIPTTSLRAIALNGHSLRPVPRVWLGDGHLTGPEISAAMPFTAADCDDCTISIPERDRDADLSPVWNGLTPEYVPEEEAELPWWVGLLGVAVLVVVAMLLTSQSGSSS